MSIDYVRSRDGLRDWFVGVEARGLCTEAAEWAADYARSIAPVGKPPDDRHPGAYRDSISVVQAGIRRGKIDRAEVHVVAEVPYAAALELQMGHGTLGKTIEALKAV